MTSAACCSARRVSSAGIGREERAAVRIRGPEVHDARHDVRRLVVPAAVLAGQRRGTCARAVERAVTGEHLAAAGERARELHRVFVRRRAADGEEHPAAFVAPGRKTHELLTQLGAHVVEPARRAEAQAVDLLVHRRPDGGMAVAEVHRDQARGQVGVAVPLLVVEVDPLAAHDHRRRQVRLRHPRREDVARVLGLERVAGQDHGSLLPSPYAAGGQVPSRGYAFTMAERDTVGRERRTAPEAAARSRAARRARWRRRRPARASREHRARAPRAREDRRRSPKTNRLRGTPRPCARCVPSCNRARALSTATSGANGGASSSRPSSNSASRSFETYETSGHERPANLVRRRDAKTPLGPDFAAASCPGGQRGGRACAAAARVSGTGSLSAPRGRGSTRFPARCRGGRSRVST